MVLDIVDASMFEYHKDEFLLLLTDINNIKLNQIALNDKLESYNDERLNKELLILLHKFYSNKLISLTYNKELNFNQKIMQIKIIKDNLSQLKQGKLVNFNL